MESLTDNKRNPLLDLHSVYFWQVDNNLNLVMISFKGMFLEIKKKFWFYLFCSTLEVNQLQILEL